ncbi:MAG: endopeptidase La [Acidobacteria bacterium]|nr:endopeptidase La [Acidobacteriota bacterium]MDA1233973.1 endopeptidase La [Acidobacteriota bacterium]
MATEETSENLSIEAAKKAALSGNDDEPLALLTVRDTVLFPHAVMPLNVGRPSSVALIESLGEAKKIGVVAQQDPSLDDPEPEDLYQVGALAIIHKVVRMPNQTLLIFTEGLSRIRIKDYREKEPFYKVSYDPIIEAEPQVDSVLEALRQNALSLFNDIIELSPSLSDDVLQMVKNLDDPGRQADFIAATIPSLGSAEKQSILEELDIRKRLEMLLRLLSKEHEVLELRSKIQSQVQDQLSQTQREFYLREQMKAIQKELGEQDEQADVEDLRKLVEKSKMPAEAKKEAEREVKRLSRMNPASADYTVARTYLDWLVALPWQKSSGKRVDIVKAAKVLDEDHYDLEKVKERILDYLAVLQLKPQLKGPILCLAGPPGVGKTSLGKSIARALGRKFIRMSLGGMHDEAEIRGHRRTYIGALPGQVIQGIKRAGTNDPVFILDEIDKLGRDFRGDPASALLEVLDPAQNNTFRDHYLDTPFDLSKVLFITTANVMDTIPGPLLDRMEVLELQGYTEFEKLQIAKSYLIPRQVQENGLDAKDIAFSDEAIRFVIRRYTREAGVRNLEREIGTICRKQARRIAEKWSRSKSKTRTAAKKLTITLEVVEEFLRSPRYREELEIAERTERPGVALGLAWTAAGGDVLFIEATAMPGGGKGMVLTGQLGKVMQESMQAALSWVRSNAPLLSIPASFFRSNDLHVHVPAGAIPKDGPSAGVTVISALVSLATGRRVRPYVAMTGEITLSGNVLPVGGIKEKVLAARRSGVTEVILPHENESDVTDDLNEEQLGDLKVHYVKSVGEVIAIALEKKSTKKKAVRKKAAKRRSR